MRTGARVMLGMAAATMLIPPPGIAQQRTMPRDAERGLCRRAAPLPPLAPEPPERRFDPRQTGRAPSAYAPRGEALPPPPPPPPPPPMVAPPPVASESIVVTGSPRDASADAARATAEPARPSAFAPRDRDGPRPRAGLLTAGEHDDLLNPELYADYVDRFLAGEPLRAVPRVDTRRVLTVAVRDGQGRPAPFAPVTLTCADGNTLTLRTLADGTAVFFPALDRLGRRVRASVPGAGAREVVLAGAEGATTQTLTVRAAAAPVRALDLALVIDTTGSMGDEIRYLQTELRAILARVRRAHPGVDLRVALIAYRDRGDAYVTRTYRFTGDLAALQRDLAVQRADGGGDEPEAVEEALARAAALGWREGAVKSLLWVADAPPHADDVAASWRAAEALRAQRVQVIPVAASDTNPGAEYLMRAAAAATQSRYLFLTDDSGVGNLHAPPAIDCYKVTSLADAVRRVLDAQLSGRRIEPDEAEVIRTVGRYDAGRCVLPPGWRRRGGQ